MVYMSRMETANLQQVVIRSATPQLSKNVLSLTEGNNSLEKAFISLKPILIIAACSVIEKQTRHINQGKNISISLKHRDSISFWLLP